MCGICGWAGGPPEAAGAETAKAMAAAIAHRGPEGDGAAPLPAGETTAGWFGHRRLRILDLSDAAHQPMASRDGSRLLVFNGEAYNFRELRRELEARGHRFRSTGDTEVVLTAFVEWGAAAVDRIDGMFALAVWDAAERRLLLARDRAGKKPLFYTVEAGRLTFASEVKALVRCPWVQPNPDWSQLGALLAFGHVAEPATMYQGISQVPPASTVTFDVETGELSEHRYWSQVPRDPRLRLDGHVLDELRDAARSAVRRRMVSDVPVGALLSGGIDSSVVTALMAAEAPGTVETFAIGFPDDPSFDERRHAQIVADALGTRHTEFAVRADAAALLDRLVWLHDGPFADSSAVPTYLVCEAAAQRVTVALTGDGGDEVFAGYQRFAAAALSRLAPKPLAGAARRVLPMLPSSGGYHDPRRRLERFLEPLQHPLHMRYLEWMRVFGDDLAGALDTASHPDPALPFQKHFHEALAAGLAPIDALLHANFCTYLPGDLAVKADRCSMGSSLELRSPLLDTRIIELMARVPAREKLGFGRPKPVLRKAFGPLVPAHVWRRPKHGFGVPMDIWFRQDLGALYADEVLASDGRARSVLAAPELARLHEEHGSGTRNHGPRMWTILTIERWLRQLEGPRPLTEPGRASALVDVA